MGCRILTISISMLFLFACSERRPPDANDEIMLSDGESRQTFLIPAKYKAQHESPSMLRFALQYPSLQPRDWQGVPQADQISVLIWMRNGGGIAELLVREAVDKADPAHPGLPYRDGKQDGYDIYRSDLDKTTLVPMVVTYVFRDDEGELVSVEDPGSWSRAYGVHRRIGSKLHVRYNIAKALGRDFRKIDREVKGFIVAHAKP